jgi:hypothetical protein
MRLQYSIMVQRPYQIKRKFLQTLYSCENVNYKIRFSLLQMFVRYYKPELKNILFLYPKFGYQSDANAHGYTRNGVIINPSEELKHSRRLYYRVYEVKLCEI